MTDQPPFVRSSGPRLPRRAFLASAAAAGAGLGCSREPVAMRGRQLLTLWFTYGGKNREVLESLIARFNREQHEIFVRGVYQGDYHEGLAKLRVALAAGAAPALSHVVGEIIPYLAETGVLEPLDGYLPKAVLDDVVPELGQARSFIGGEKRPTLALPFNRSTPIAYLNAEIFAKAGLSAPRTWEELRRTARELTQRTTGGAPRFGFGCPVDWWFWVALVGQAGGNVVEADGRISLGDEAGVEALEFWRTLVQRDRSMRPPPGRDYNAWEQTNQAFLSGRVAMIWTSTAFLKYLEENARFSVLAAPLPAHARSAVPTGGTYWVILRAAPEVEKRAAARFLAFMLASRQARDWSVRTGYIPVTRQAISDLRQEQRFAKYPNEGVALGQLTNALPWPWSRELFRVAREIVQPRLERAVLAGDSARPLLEAARREAREI